MSSPFPTVPAGSVGWLTTDQMIEVDRVMIEDLGIQLIQMMENAGRNLARLALARYGPTAPVVAVGSGGNGGGGLVAARHLVVAGLPVRVVLATTPDRFGPIPKHQFDIIERLGVPVLAEVPNNADLVIDAVIGYSLKGAPRGRAGTVIADMDASLAPVLSLDTPSGLDTATGVAFDPHVRADATLTLALPKVGLRTHPAVGDLYLADISVPGSVYEGLDAGPAPDFSKDTIFRISDQPTH